MNPKLSSLLARFSAPPTGAVSFPVDDVTPASQLRPARSLQQDLQYRFKRRILVLPEPQRPVVRSLGRCHPLIDAVHTAFSEHRPLLLSPDAIWLVIAQGFGHHLVRNAEALRGRLVRHQGKRELTAHILDLDLPNVRTAIRGFSSQIREASDPVLHETLICDFSTTTPDLRTASEIVLMDCYSPYFEYIMRCVCGIPSVTLTGSPEDWQRILDRVEVLETYDLTWWVSRLRPILDQLLMTSRNQPDRDFWQAIYKPKSTYGDVSVTGWIADLFPYLGDEPSTRARNHVLEHTRENWAMPVAQGVKTGFFFGEPGAEKGVRQRSFPSGISSVPVKLTGVPGIEEVDFVGGFLTVDQDPKTKALSPMIGWSVTDRAPAAPLLVRD